MVDRLQCKQERIANELSLDKQSLTHEQEMNEVKHKALLDRELKDAEQKLKLEKERKEAEIEALRRYCALF